MLANQKGKKNIVIEMLKLVCSLLFTTASSYLACNLSPFYKCQTQISSCV